ncbi:glycosyltransferase family 4 protein [Micromonospora echinospora]|uniref:glycosyltransferase family 4 protein n=1 Tax=Micromonospora echinospora TaxID=1877 RepID=UPI003670F112
MSGRRLRVAYVLAHPPGPSETFVSAEVRAVRATGAIVEVFPVGPGGGRVADLRRAAGRLLRQPGGLPADLRVLGARSLLRGVLACAGAAGLAGPVARFRPDVLHAHFVNLPTAVALLLARRLDRPVTATAHAADFLREPHPAALRRRLSRLDHLFVVSAASVAQLAAGGVPMATVPHRIVRAAHDGRIVDPDRERPPPAPGPARLVTVARLVAKKGVPTAVDAVARLVAAGHDLRYDVYGDGPLRAGIRRQARRYGLAGTVHLHGAVPHEVAMAALRGADVAVLPCRAGPDGDLDGIPVFLMEAAGRGVPVVTTALSGIPELVGPDAGWRVPPDDPAAVADAVRAVLADPGEARRRSRVLQARLRSEFAPATQAERLVDTWTRLVDQHGSDQHGNPHGTGRRATGALPGRSEPRRSVGGSG